ncbi:MAG: hypothetical protein ABIH34_07865 [Nanoarchaeota archaeon]
MERWEILNNLFDHKKIALLQLFFQQPEKQWYLSELAKEAKLSPATSLRILRLLRQLALIKQENVGNAKLYRASQDEHFSFLAGFLQQERQFLSEFVKKAASIEGLQTIILHGKALKSRANIMLIGDKIDAQQVKELTSEFFERFSFTISPLTLTQEQFEQMTAMGLYAGEKRILFQRT